MVKFLSKVSPKTEVYDFDIIGPQGQILMPQYWSRVVQPGWSIELLFHESNLNLSSMTKRRLRLKEELEDLQQELEYKKAMDALNGGIWVNFIRRLRRLKGDRGLVMPWYDNRVRTLR